MSHIFNSGLLSTNSFHDFNQMAVVAASVWDQRYRKLGKGSEFGFAHQLNLPMAQLTHTARYHPYAAQQGGAAHVGCCRHPRISMTEAEQAFKISAAQQCGKILLYPHGLPDSQRDS